MTDSKGIFFFLLFFVLLSLNGFVILLFLAEKILKYQKFVKKTS